MSSTEEYFKRADAHVKLANSQIEAGGHPGEVCGAFVHAASRFNAWIVATSCTSSEELAAKRDEKLEFFADQYKQMMAQNLDDYIAHFEGLKKS